MENLGEKAAWAYPGTVQFFEYPILSQECVKLRTSNFVLTFVGSIRKKSPLKISGKVGWSIVFVFFAAFPDTCLNKNIALIWVVFLAGNLQTLVRRCRRSIVAVYYQWVNGRTLLLSILYLGQVSFLLSNRWAFVIWLFVLGQLSAKLVIDPNRQVTSHGARLNDIVLLNKSFQSYKEPDSGCIAFKLGELIDRMQYRVQFACRI